MVKKRIEEIIKEKEEKKVRIFVLMMKILMYYGKYL